MRSSLCDCGRPITHQFIATGRNGQGNLVEFAVYVCDACLALEKEMSQTGMLRGLEKVVSGGELARKVGEYLNTHESGSYQEIAVAVGAPRSAVMRYVARHSRQFTIVRELRWTTDRAQRQVVVVSLSSADPSPSDGA